MKQDIRNISYTFQKDKEDKDLLYKINVLLYQEIDYIFCCDADTDTNIDKAYYNVLQARDTITEKIVRRDMKDETENIDKLFYLVNEEFDKVLNRVKKRFIEEDKTKKRLLKQKEQKKEQDLMKLLEEHFTYCLETMKQKRSINTILTLMCTYDFRQATIEDLDIDIKKYKDFDKIFDKVLNEFKKHHKYDLDELTEQTSKFPLGWKIYGVTKIIEGLFKI